MMKKTFLLAIFIVMSSMILCGCNGTPKEKFYGWWKPENPSLMNNKPLYISESEIISGKKYKITEWIKEDGKYKIAFDNIVVSLELTKNGNLIFIPQVYLGSAHVFIPTTESEVKADEAKRKERLKNMTKSKSDPF